MRIETYKDGAGEWRWRLLAGNGKIIAESGEGYSKRGNLRRALLRLADGVRELEEAIIVELFPAEDY